MTPVSSFARWESPGECILCEGTRLRSLPRLRHLQRCRRCGHLQLSPRPTQAQIAESYDLPSESTHATWDAQQDGRRQLWAKRADRVTRHLAGPGRVLDIGAGFGDFLIALRERGWDGMGTEISADAVARAGERGVDLSLGQPEDVHLPSSSFDLVTMWHVLEHMPYPGRTLAECARVVRPGGWVVVAVPNDSLFPRLTAYVIAGRSEAIQALWGKRRPGEEIHLSFFSPQRLEKAMRLVGLSDVIVDLDDHYPEPDSTTERHFKRHRALWLATGRTFSLHRTILAAGRRSDEGEAIAFRRHAARDADDSQAHSG